MLWTISVNQRFQWAMASSSRTARNYRGKSQDFVGFVSGTPWWWPMLWPAWPRSHRPVGRICSIWIGGTSPNCWQGASEIGLFGRVSHGLNMACWLVVWNMMFIPFSWECYIPNWLSYFSEGLKPPSSLFCIEKTHGFLFGKWSNDITGG